MMVHKLVLLLALGLNLLLLGSALVAERRGSRNVVRQSAFPAAIRG